MASDQWAILCNPLHIDGLEAVVRVSPFGAETIPTGRDLADEARRYDTFNDAAQDWLRCVRLDENYFPWISPFIAEIEAGRISAIVCREGMADQMGAEQWLRDVIDPLGVPIVEREYA